MIQVKNHQGSINRSMYSSELEPSSSKKRKTSFNGHTVSKPVAIKGGELRNGKKQVS